MGLESLSAVESRIAEIQSLFAGAPTARNSGAAATALPSVLPTTGTSTGTSADSNSFNDLLAKYGSVQSQRPSLPQTNLLPRVGEVAPLPSGNGARYEQFAHDVLAGIGAPDTSENVRALKAWALAEGTKATFNPLATTKRWANTTNFNSVGVKNFASYEDGVAATIATLHNGHYPNILAAFADGSDAQRVAQAVADSPWGTKTGVLRVLRAGTV